MKLLLVRHGESVSNADPVAVALPEAKGDRLTERGREQATAAGRALAGAGAVELLSSPMRRARETAELISAETGLEVEADEEIHELGESRGYGELGPEEQKLRRWSEWMVEHAGDPDYSYEGGESFNGIRARVRAFKDRLAAGDPKRTTIAVSHGIFIRFFLFDSVFDERFGPGDTKRLWRLRSANCGISTFERGEVRHPASPIDPEAWICVSWMERPG